METYEKLKRQLKVFGITEKDLKEELGKYGIKATQKSLKEYLRGKSDIPSEWLEVIKNYLPDYNLDRFEKILSCLEGKGNINKFIQVFPKIDYKYFEDKEKNYLLDIRDTQIYQKYVIMYLRSYLKNKKSSNIAKRKLFLLPITSSVKSGIVRLVKIELRPKEAAGIVCAAGIGGYGKYKMKNS